MYFAGVTSRPRLRSLMSLMSIHSFSGESATTSSCGSPENNNNNKAITTASTTGEQHKYTGQTKFVLRERVRNRNIRKLVRFTANNDGDEVVARHHRNHRRTSSTHNVSIGEHRRSAQQNLRCLSDCVGESRDE
eukprot:m.176707 g.176707  ORF g.176707 m.176707 type:complete len:134 (+) comp13535_c0_seq5:2716-3117(+)